MRFINGTDDSGSSGLYVLRPIGSSPPLVLKKPSSTSSSSLPAAFCPPATRILMPTQRIEMITSNRNTPAPASDSVPEHFQKQAPVSPPMRCNFCRKNGEPVASYSSHRLHNENGTTQCPILRSLVCKICNEDGDNAHTISYCPWAKSIMPIIEESIGKGEARLNMGDLRMTRFSAAGKRQVKKTCFIGGNNGLGNVANRNKAFVCI